MNFGSVLTAMVTPFDQQGDINYTQTAKLIEYLLKNGTEGLVVAGTTGESPTLSKEEKLNLFKYVVKVVNKRVPIIAGTGSNNTTESIALTHAAEECGVDAIMLVAPYYNKPDQRGLYEHFKTISASTDLPIMLYNIPGRSIVNMTAETVIKLSEIDNIVAIKDASGDLDQIAEVIEASNNHFTVYSGEDSLTLPMLSIGATGVISVASHIIGNEMQDMIQSYNKGNVKKAASIHRSILPIMNGLFASPSPVPVKTALNIQGLDVGTVRLPLVPLTNEEKNELIKLMER